MNLIQLVFLEQFIFTFSFQSYYLYKSIRDSVANHLPFPPFTIAFTTIYIIVYSLELFHTIQIHQAIRNSSIVAIFNNFAESRFSSSAHSIKVLVDLYRFTLYNFYSSHIITIRRRMNWKYFRFKECTRLLRLLLME